MDGIAPKNPKVSVVVPVYNEQLRLRKCLDSVCAQTLRDIEIICVNDGSTDASCDILRAYAEKDGRITVISQENRGLSAARNRAFALTRGEYVYFLDSDDSIVPEALDTAYSAAVLDELDIFLFDSQYDEDSTHLHVARDEIFRRAREYARVCSGKEMLVNLASEKHYLSNVWLCLYRRAFLSEAGLAFHEGALFEDNFFSLAALLKARRTRHMRKVLHRAYLGGESISRGTVTPLHINSITVALTDMLSAMMLTEFDNDEQRKACLHAFRNVRELAPPRIRSLRETEPEWEPDILQRAVYALLGLTNGIPYAEEDLRHRDDALPDWAAKSATWRIGRVITFIPGKIKHALRKVKIRE